MDSSREAGAADGRPDGAIRYHDRGGSGAGAHSASKMDSEGNERQ